jgi:hypothetical protein
MEELGARMAIAKHGYCGLKYEYMTPIARLTAVMSRIIIPAVSFLTGGGHQQPLHSKTVQTCTERPEMPVLAVPRTYTRPTGQWKWFCSSTRLPVNRGLLANSGRQWPAGSPDNFVTSHSIYLSCHHEWQLPH